VYVAVQFPFALPRNRTGPVFAMHSFSAAGPERRRYQSALRCDCDVIRRGTYGMVLQIRIFAPDHSYLLPVGIILLETRALGV
jgi:hypothetical protein